MSIHLLAIGCDYKGTSYSLPDCEEYDAQGLDEDLTPYLKSGTVLIGKNAAREGMIAASTKLRSRYRKGDVLLCSFSGHGTTDIVNGKRMQAIVCNDGTLIWEDELRQYLADFPLAVFLADSCFSGGLVRSMHLARTIAIENCVKHVPLATGKVSPNPHAKYLACNEKETAASTGEGGAMTLAVRRSIHETGETTTLAGIAKRIKKLLPNREYTQHPQFVCEDKAFANRTLKSFMRAA